jgi:hypothetical protein
VGREEQSQKAKPKMLSLLPFDFCVLPFDLLFGFFLPHSIRREVS